MDYPPTVKGHSVMPSDLRNAFSACGDMRDAYPTRAFYANSESPYFIESTESNGLKRAFRLDGGNETQAFNPVSTSPLLIEDHQSADPSGSAISKPQEPHRSNFQNIPIVNDIGRVRCYPVRGAHIRSAVLTPSTNLAHAPERKYPDSNTVLADSYEPSTPTSRNMLDSSSLLSPIVINSQKPSVHTSEKSQRALVSPLTYTDPAKAANSLTVPCLPLTTHIRLCLCGELFSYDLNSLQSDPREIIKLLKCTGSERGNWMVVGAFYRRQGNPHAAIAVIQSMLEVMAHHGISDNELKPAFLLLSGCESDLSKFTRSEGRITNHHQQKAQTWLQKVYGGMKDQSDNIDMNHPEVKSTASSSSRSDSDEYLRREIQSLRDRLNHQVGLSAGVRFAKRKLEESYNLERATRRRLEREIRCLKAERDEMRGR
ncbi:hypothetical protein DFJ43DRAFT_1067236 [Lentinula guzmanii]|uniref:Uncharacterized protein n=1 Tax=Lentinula guzmanii TaxID=2804957 RepID=A0AA38N2H9_9AGAR|nr:hypothetical protein DFJ43DRAFT_1067236 [Lentinula guzmanii]